jgi:hypothetical protein
VVDGQLLGDHAAHRLADDVGGLDLERVQELSDVVGQIRNLVGQPGLPLGRQPHVTVVEQDDSEALHDEQAPEVRVPGRQLAALPGDKE